MAARKKKGTKIIKIRVPSDYEPCGYCGFDHSYEYAQALAWHKKNDPRGLIYK